ncbi:MAG: HEAT repeat protein [Planctomycetota bacterium]|jgi:HEAT repeat protein
MKTLHALRSVIFSLTLSLLIATTLDAQSSSMENHVNEMFANARSSSSGLLSSAKQVVSDGSMVTPFLLDGLQDRQPAEIVWALRCLKNLKDKSSGSVVIQLLKHEDETVRSEAILIAKVLYGKKLGSMVFDLTKDKSLSVRRRALDAAIELVPHDPRMVDLAFDSLADGDFWLMSRALRVLSKMQVKTPEDKLNLIERSLKIAPRLNGNVAEMFFAHLSRALAKDTRVVLERTLDRGRIGAKVAAFECAGKLRLREFLPKARKLIRASNRKIRTAAIRYTGMVKDKDSASLLIPLLDEFPPGEMQTAVVIALRKISGQTIGFDSSKWRAWLNEVIVRR